MVRTLCYSAVAQRALAVIYLFLSFLKFISEVDFVTSRVWRFETSTSASRFLVFSSCFQNILQEITLQSVATSSVHILSSHSSLFNTGKRKSTVKWRNVNQSTQKLSFKRVWYSVQ